MCAVGGLVRRGARSNVLAGHHISCLSSIGQIDVNMFVVRAGWCPQLTTNIVKFYLFINAHVFFQ